MEDTEYGNRNGVYKMKDDIVKSLSQVDKRLSGISDEIQDVIEQIQYFNYVSAEASSSLWEISKKMKNSMFILGEILQDASDQGFIEEDFDLYGKDYPIDYPISSYIDEDGFFVVKFDFDIPVIKHRFDTNDRFCLENKILDLPNSIMLDDMFLAYEFHQGGNNYGADLKEIENRDMRYITDLLVCKYSNNGDNGDHFREYRYIVQDGEYYTNAYLLDIKNIAKFIEKHP